MSLRALSARAVQRDTPAVVPPPPPPPPGAELQGGGAPGGAGVDLSSATGVLVDAIPGEVLAPYTALIGIIVSASASKTHEPLRWWIFFVTLALIPTFLILNYYRGRPADRNRVLPFAETLAAMLAFAAWALVMPGSPLSLDISGDDLTIVTAILAIGGAFIVTLLVLSLSKKSKAAA
jgi:hypothetical protein